MASLFKKHPVAVILSVLFHVLLISFFVVQFNFFDQPVQSKPVVNTVKATVVDESKVRAEADKLKKLEQQKKLKEKRRLDKMKADRLKKEKKLADLKNKQKQQEKKIKDQKVVEAARLAKLKKQQAEQAKKKAAEDKRKKQAEAKKRAQEKAKQEQANRLSAMLEAANNEEQERLAQKAIASFTDIIRQKVESNWIQPAGNIAGLLCKVRVKLIPGGEVISAQIAKSSGNALFDRSVEIATLKASPLPIPNDPAMFNQFRNLEFIFRPSE